MCGIYFNIKDSSFLFRLHLYYYIIYNIYYILYIIFIQVYFLQACSFPLFSLEEFSSEKKMCPKLDRDELMSLVTRLI